VRRRRWRRRRWRWRRCWAVSTWPPWLPSRCRRSRGLGRRRSRSRRRVLGYRLAARGLDGRSRCWRHAWKLRILLPRNAPLPHQQMSILWTRRGRVKNILSVYRRKNHREDGMVVRWPLRKQMWCCGLAGCANFCVHSDCGLIPAGSIMLLLEILSVFLTINRILPG